MDTKNPAQIDDITPVVKQFYPDAVPLESLMHSVVQSIFNEYDYTPNQILLANSICSDDINSLEYPAEARQMLGPFELGGLNGFPFTGLTGMAAFASHVPDDGAVMIFYGPHIGVTNHGKAGRVTRPGQNKESTCCGAAALALSRINEPAKSDELDYQQRYLEKLMKDNKHRIHSAGNPEMEAAEIFYEANEKRLMELIHKTDFTGNHIFLIGGIIINCRQKFGSFISLRNNSVLEARSLKITGRLGIN